jgi:hypothetical protein
MNLVRVIEDGSIGFELLRSRMNLVRFIEDGSIGFELLRSRMNLVRFILIDPKGVIYHSLQ